MPKEWGWRTEYADRNADADALDNTLIEALYGFPVRRYRCALGLHWYMVDSKATRDGLKHLIGARWERGYDDTGALAEFFGRLRPSPSRSLDVCAEAEAEIARRGLSDAYARALCDVLEISIAEHESYYDPSVDVEHDLFLLITAPPDVRVRAMLQVLEG